MSQSEKSVTGGPTKILTLTGKQKEQARKSSKRFVTYSV